MPPYTGRTQIDDTVHVSQTFGFLDGHFKLIDAAFGTDSLGWGPGEVSAALVASAVPVKIDAQAGFRGLRSQTNAQPQRPAGGRIPWSFHY
jgi:hypothetical protein